MVSRVALELGLESRSRGCRRAFHISKLLTTRSVAPWQLAQLESNNVLPAVASPLVAASGRARSLGRCRSSLRGRLSGAGRQHDQEQAQPEQRQLDP